MNDLIMSQDGANLVQKIKSSANATIDYTDNHGPMSFTDEYNQHLIKSYGMPLNKQSAEQCSIESLQELK